MVEINKSSQSLIKEANMRIVLILIHKHETILCDDINWKIFTLNNVLKASKL